MNTDLSRGDTCPSHMLPCVIIFFELLYIYDFSLQLLLILILDPNDFSILVSYCTLTYSSTSTFRIWPSYHCDL